MWQAALYITALQPVHASQAARLHIAGQPDTFLTNLGPDVLATIYHLLPQSRHGFGCAALAGDSASVLGFVAATTGVGSLFVEMSAKRLADLAPPLLKRFARRPDLLWRSMQTVLYPLLVRESGASSSTASNRTAELLSIMVLPEQRGRGIGALLLHSLVEISRARKLDAIHVTVDANNLGAQRFYLRHGFNKVRTFSLYGRPMCLYHRNVW